MHRARMKDSDHHVFRHDIGPPHSFAGDLICWKCPAPVVAVRKYRRLGAPVKAQYRLAPQAEHTPTCPLNPAAISDHIAHGSHGLAEVGNHGILRLNLPEGLNHFPPDNGEEADDQVTDTTEQHKVTTVRPLLPPAVNSAAKIVQFLQLHDFDHEIIGRFKIRLHNGQTIDWDAFCYGPAPASYATLYQRCHEHHNLTHPVAVFGTVQQIAHDRQDRPYAVLATGVAPRGGGKHFQVLVRSVYPHLIEPLSAGTQLLATGAAWNAFPGVHTPSLRLFAVDHWQLAYWEAGGDGSQPAPRCPPPVSDQQRNAARIDARRRTPRA